MTFASPLLCLHFPSKFEWSPLWILPKFSVIPPLGFSVTTDPPFHSPIKRIRPNRAGIPLDKSTWKWHRNLEHYQRRLKDIELQRWLIDVNNDVRNDANQKNELRTFRKFKTIENYKCEDYLRQVTNVRHRITLTKLRLSNHKLVIETGRYVRPYKKPEERICPICKRRRRWNTLFNSVPCVSRKKKYFIWILKQRIQSISKQNGTR